MRPIPMQPGTVLNEKYRLESVLGRGGMGSVWRAEHLGLRAPVAVKLMDPALALTPDALARFHREAHAAATIRSPHVVQVLDHGVDEPSNTPFIVMELLNGETLGERLAREGTLSPGKTAKLIADVCRALTRAHEAGIVHRDLKPENIFLVDDDREFAKVLDFGVAKSQPFALGASTSSSSGSLVGTPCYMSPEHINGSKHLDGRSDLWSVAVIACECITGRCPFDEDTLGNLLLAICTGPAPRASTLGRVTPAFEAWLARALEQEPGRRFQTARELADSLRSACVEGESGASPSERRKDTLVLFGPGRADSSAVDAVTTRGAERSTAKLVATSGALMLLVGVGAWVALGEPTVGVRASAVAAAPMSEAELPLPLATSAAAVPAESAPRASGSAASGSAASVPRASGSAASGSAESVTAESVTAESTTAESARRVSVTAKSTTAESGSAESTTAASVPLEASGPPQKRPARKAVIRRSAPPTSLQSALEGARGRERK